MVMTVTTMKIMEMMAIIIGVGLSSLLTTVFLRNAMGQASSHAVQSEKNVIDGDIVIDKMGVLLLLLITKQPHRDVVNFIVIYQMGILWTRL